jgi:copper(I)-binding protein
MRTVLLAAIVTMATLACDVRDEAERTPSATLGPISIYDAFAPASPASDVASVYFTVVNNSAEADTLSRVSITEGHAHLHEVLTEDDRTRMSPVAAVPVPGHGTLRLAPGGYHIMLTSMGVPLKPGDTTRIALEFARAGTLNLEVAVLTYTEVVERLQASESAHR